jgi:hypothetical protein
MVAADLEDVWELDPTLLALEQSTWREDRLPEPFCLDVGRRLLLAELEFSEWILRRVEKVDLSRDRSVSRRIALEFAIRDDAPQFRSPGGRRWSLIPLSMMRRRTLVNLELTDQHDDAVFMPGIRLCQQLDQAILLAAAASLDPEIVEQAEVRRFAQLAIAGERQQVRWAYSTLAAATDGPLRALREDALFRWTAERFRHNFSLFTFLEVAEPRPVGHRLIRLSFDEPTDRRYKLPELAPLADDPTVYAYRPEAQRDDDREPETRLERYTAWIDGQDHVGPRLLASIGFKPKRYRFQTPAAECAASYHFEIEAPPGIQIVKASLLAGRPNDPGRHVSQDEVVGHTPVAGLHAVEVPNGSLCRAQVDVALPTRGWLATVCASSWAITFVLLSVAIHWHRAATVTNAGQISTTVLPKDEITNLVLIMVTTSAAVATLIAQRDGGVLAAQLVAGLRMLATCSLVLPLFAAGLLTYSGLRSPLLGSPGLILWLLSAAGILLALVFTWALLVSFSFERRSVAKESPWDQTGFEDIPADQLDPNPPGRQPPNFLEAIARLGFDTPAVGIRSAEAWHRRYAWTDERQRDAMWTLERLRQTLAPGDARDSGRGIGCRCPVCRVGRANAG